MRHLLRRILFYLVALWASVTLNFFIPRLAPGNPAEAMMLRFERQGHLAPETEKALQAAFGLNTTDPLYVQYFRYLGDLLQGRLGTSLTNYPTPVKDVIAQGIQWTLILGGIAVIISFILGCLLGIIMAWKRGSFLDTFLAPATTFLSSIPYFWLALIIVYIFGYTLGWFPFSDGFDTALDIGWSPDFIFSALYHGILPALTIVLSSVSGWLLVMRNSMITTLSEDYVLMANAKGLAPRRVMFSYAARNAILPNVAGFALSLGTIVGGQLLTEIVFSYPGIGYTLLQAVQGQDYALIQGIFLIIALAILAANFLADLVYTLLDPRVRQERSA
ncbi:peptide ABC transporter permease [Ktedonobacter sp. SOSP1-52]|uniref:ABC transporter permease n=1 Tax=Ktedonobacter sp. SOSP1-52 TaxID=2778366 RepID=UPI0019163A0A|nr:ABC transporter permease [Ktedonobacter sp. SOSP1-52]GHO66076.1 peptide ABC transporter permease [Ktedonobacter sp. SOSP1-52]